MKWQMTGLRVLLALVFIVNLGLGVMAFSSEPMTLKVINTIYGIHLEGLEEHTRYIIKMLGCFLISISLMSVMAIRDPIKNKVVVYGNAIWLALRGIQRVTYVERFHQDWGIPYSSLWSQVIFVFAFALALLLLMPRKREA
jgi:hypothetical protein